MGVLQLVDGDYREFVCGWGAAIINIAFTYPMHKLIFRQMLHGIGVNNAYQQIADEGLASLYRGMLPPLMQKSVSSSLMFGSYDIFRKNISSLPIHPLMANSVSAFLSGTVEALLTPFERIQTLLQDSAYQKDFINMKDATRTVYYKYGIKELYRGLVPILWRNGPSNVVFFILREEMNDSFLVSSTNNLNSIKQFAIGASIGAVNSTLFYPFNVVKVHMQSQLGMPFVSMCKAFKEIYVERGRKIGSFYHGVHLNYTRSFISWGVINMAYESLKNILYADEGL